MRGAFGRDLPVMRVLRGGPRCEGGDEVSGGAGEMVKGREAPCPGGDWRADSGAGEGLAALWGARLLWGAPKGCRGERREAGIQWIQPPKAVSAPEFRQTTSGAHGSANRADCLPRGKPPAFLPEYLTPLGFPPTTARRGCRGASGKPPCLPRREKPLLWKIPLVGD